MRQNPQSFPLAGAPEGAIASVDEERRACRRSHQHQPSRRESWRFQRPGDAAHERPVVAQLRDRIANVAERGVRRVLGETATDLGSLDAADAEYFAARAHAYLTVDLNTYHAVMAIIKQKYAGTRVGASENVFVYMAAALGLNLITPAGYMKSISEGQDPSAADRAEVERQIASKEIKVFVVNAQNSTPDVQGLVAKVKASGIAVTTITETLAPSGATFQDWQTHQMQDLLRSLGGP